MVTINSSVSQNSWGGVFSINESNRLMSESLERLRTGFRIASAKDDPSGFVDALDLSRRISSHEAAINNNQSTYSELAQFEDLQRSIIDTLNEIRAELVKGRDDTDPLVRQAVFASVEGKVAAIDYMSRKTTRSGNALMAGGGHITLGSEASTLLDINTTHIRQSHDAGSLTVGFQAANAAERAYFQGAFTAAPRASNSIMTITTAEGSRTVSVDQNFTLAQTIDYLNTELVNIGAFAEQNGAGTDLVIATDEYGDEQTLSVTLDSGAGIAVGLVNPADNVTDTGVDGSLLINGRAFALEGDLTVHYSDPNIRGDLVFDGDAVGNNPWTAAAATDQTIYLKPEGGLNLHIGTETSNYDSVRLGFRDLTASGLGIDNIITAGTSSYIMDNIDGAIAAIDAALELAHDATGDLGNVLNYTLERQNDLLSGYMEELHDRRSEIMDVDDAMETARITRLQMIQQAGVSTIAADRSSTQTILSLLNVG